LFHCADFFWNNVQIGALLAANFELPRLGHLRLPEHQKLQPVTDNAGELNAYAWGAAIAIVAVGGVCAQLPFKLKY